MKIASSDMVLQSQHKAIKEHERHERLNLWVGERPTDNARGSGRAQASVISQVDQLELSWAAQASQPQKASAAVSTDEGKPELTSEDELKLSLLKRMFEFLTGKKLVMASPGDFAKKMEKAQQNAEATAAELNRLHNQANAGSAENQSAGFSIEYDYYERHYEAESTQFSAQGQVITADGQTIDIGVELNMSREFLREQSVSIRAGDTKPKLKDPLVLNFNGNAAELTSTRFEFDIDSDGRADQIAFVGPDSGFLALDRNADGKINDGRELFGPSTGAGFAELAEYDDDGNGWIDENDSIYKDLRIWSKTADGQDQLVGLGERGVGAIYLGHVTSPFELKDQDNNLLGQVRSSGVFLSEQGASGTVQQIDLAV
ncbi:hypothetical protein [Rhabdochromatium marinum]|uniref:hypothetical protein n=1 Tax=Rhabdochromatium marinum TaxID=48729 RepID=UPI0019067945|nr:hypothetical protein [Rhabdochromatium marinum]MBK1647913.1 hypothetical protein [Rhabdochromatium marinum]